MKNSIAALSAAFLLAGCVAQASQNVEDPQEYGRVDCQRSADSPELAQLFEQAKAICVNRAQAAGIAATAGMPSSGRGLGAAIADGMVQGITSAQISNATATSCMAEQGYILRPHSAHLAACEPIWAKRAAEAAAAAKTPANKKKRTAKPPSLAAFVNSPSPSSSPPK